MSTITKERPAKIPLVGLMFVMAAALGFATGLAVVGLVATGLALVAAFLNATSGIFPGRRLYPIAARARRAVPA